jgi:hypothetical protein
MGPACTSVGGSDAEPQTTLDIRLGGTCRLGRPAAIALCATFHSLASGNTQNNYALTVLIMSSINFEC